jgi:small subunit ribosomal protein S8
MTDPISDMLTHIRNATAIGKAEVVLPYSKFKQSLGEILQSQGLVSSVEISEKGERKFLNVKLKYQDGRPVISGVKRVSKPGQRIYASAKEIPRTQNGFGVTILSTPRGLMSDMQARKERLGGEIICQIW